MTTTATLPAEGISRDKGTKQTLLVVDCPVLKNSDKGLAVVYQPKLESYMILHIKSRRSLNGWFHHEQPELLVEIMDKLISEFDDWDNAVSWNKAKVDSYKKREKELWEQMPYEEEEDIEDGMPDIDEDDNEEDEDD